MEEKVKAATIKILAMLIARNPALGAPIVRYISQYFIEQLLTLMYKNVDLYFELIRIEEISNEQRKSMEVAKLEYQIARIKGDPNEIAVAEKNFKEKFDSFIKLNSSK